MPRKKNEPSTAVPAPSKSAAKAEKSTGRKRTERKFPPLTFQESLTLAQAIQTHAAGQKVRRLVLFEKLDQSPDSNESRRLVTSSNQYGLTKGSYTAEFLELTQLGSEATSDEVSPDKQLSARFSLAVSGIQPFQFLYEKVKGNKLPAKEILADSIPEAGIDHDQAAECIDTFILNIKFLGLLRMIGGSERLVKIEQAVEEAGKNPRAPKADTPSSGAIAPPAGASVAGEPSSSSPDDFSSICFYITPIGDDDSEERKHADFFMEYIIQPAVKELGLTVVRADKMGKPGMIGKQVIEHILKSKLVVVDLSFHNPNVFYELCLRHTTRLPTVQVKREQDKIPFDLNQYRTIPIETRDVYSLLPKIQSYTAEVANQARRALQDSESGDNPISLYYPSARLTWDEK